MPPSCHQEKPADPLFPGTDKHQWERDGRLV